MIMGNNGTRQIYIKKTITNLPLSFTYPSQPCLVWMAETVAIYQNAFALLPGCTAGLYFPCPFTISHGHVPDTWPMQCEQKRWVSLPGLAHKILPRKLNYASLSLASWNGDTSMGTSKASCWREQILHWPGSPNNCMEEAALPTSV